MFVLQALVHRGRLHILSVNNGPPSHHVLTYSTIKISFLCTTYNVRIKAFLLSKQSRMMSILYIYLVIIHLSNPLPETRFCTESPPCALWNSLPCKKYLPWHALARSAIRSTASIECPPQAVHTCMSQRQLLIVTAVAIYHHHAFT